MVRLRFLILFSALIVSCSRQSPQQQTSSLGRQQPHLAAAAAVAPMTSAAAADDPAPARPCPSRPNILIISLDTLRADATQLDPKSSNRTPVLARLGASGVNFTTAYSTWDSTPPSHFSMLTGYVNGHLGEIDQPDASVARQLQRLGYRTFGVAANGNLSPKAERVLIPFGRYVNLADEWDGLPADAKARLASRMDALLARRHVVANDWYHLMMYGSADRVLEHLDPLLDGKQPFLGFLNFIDTHDPYLPPDEFYDWSRDKPDLVGLRFRPLPPELANPDGIVDPVRRQYIKGRIEQAQGRAWSVAVDLTKEQIRTYHRRYNAEARNLDRSIGKLFEMLERRGLLDSTVVVLTSDHGESFGEDDLVTHSFNNGGDREATNRVNLLFVFPPCYGRSGIQVQQYCTIADVVPTLYDLLGIDPTPLRRKTVPGNFGRSLLPLMSVVPAPQPTVAAKADAPPVPPEERKRQDDEALKRFRALGYLQ